MRAIQLVVAACGAASLMAGCGKSDPSAASPTTSADGWQCFQRDPAQPAAAQGNITFVRQRLIEGHLEADSVFEAGAGSGGGASRLVFKPAGDHLEAQVKGVAMTARLLTADAAHWVLSYAAPGHGRTFSEDSVLADGVLTVTSIDPSGDPPTRTPVRFLPASCDAVVAALAAYP